MEPEVILLDDDDDLLETLGDLVQLTCRRASVRVHSLAELVEQRAVALGCQLAILDINLGANQPSGIDALRWLQEQGFAGRIVFLTGHARSHPMVAEAHRLRSVQVLQKPIEIAELVSLVTGSS